MGTPTASFGGAARMAALSGLLALGGTFVVSCGDKEADPKPAVLRQVDLYTPQQWADKFNVKLEVPIMDGLAIVKCVPTPNEGGAYMLKVDILLSKAGIKAMADKIASRSPYTADDLMAYVNLQKPQTFGQGYMGKTAEILSRSEEHIPTTSLTPNPNSKEMNFKNLQSPGTEFNVTIGLDLPSEVKAALKAEGLYKSDYQDGTTIKITLGQ